MREGFIKDRFGNIFWFCNDKLHREDGPAVEFQDGSKSWHLHGERIDCCSQEEFKRLLKVKAFW